MTRVPSFNSFSLQNSLLLGESALSRSQIEMDSAFQGFSQEATNITSLSAMILGGVTYRLARLGFLQATSSLASHALLRFVPQLLAPVVGLSAEVTVFEGSQRLLSVLNGEARNNPNLLSWSGSGGLSEGLRNAFVDFGVMKSVGHFLRSENIFFRHLSQDLSMMAGHQATALIGLTTQPEGNFFDQLLRAELMNLQMEVGNAFVGRLSGYRLQILERNLETFHRSFQPMGAFENLRDQPVLTRMASREKESISSLDALRSLYETAPSSIRSRLDPVHDYEKNVQSKDIEERLSKSVRYGVDDLLELHESPYHRFSREEKNWLRQVLVFRLQEKKDFYQPRLILQALQDFNGMRQLLRVLTHHRTHYERALLCIKDLGEPERILSDMSKVPLALEKLWGETLDPYWRTYVSRFCAEFGFNHYSGFDMLKAARALRSLSSSYDYVVAIAKGGLCSGAIAQLLGMDVTVIEVHAHGRRHPQLRLRENLDPEKIRGKRVLLLDKDVITGASIHESVKLIAPHEPAQVGIFLNLGPTQSGERGIGSNPDVLEAFKKLGIAVHYPENVRPLPSVDLLFYQVHERLQTPLGSLRKILRDWEETLRSIQGLDPEHLAVIRQYLEQRQQVYAGLNHFLPGTEEIRQRIISNLGRNLEILKSYQQIDLPEFPPSNICSVLSHEADLPHGSAEVWARGRYEERGLQWLKKKQVESQHKPHNYCEAFHCAQRAMKDKYDYALLVGPEAFPYAPLFEDLGLPLVSVNIPEADYGGERSFRSFDNLKVLRNKRVLVVEDDVQSGATLEKLLQEISPSYAPNFLGLYLASRPNFQDQSNIPKVFRRVYVNDGDAEVAEQAFLKHLQSRASLFKSKRKG